jgi:hypothetical protein
MPVANDKATTARRLGYGDDIAAMDRDHDPLHRAVCAWLGVPSHSLRVAAGEQLTPEEQRLAWIEESAVLELQCLMRNHGLAIEHGMWRRVTPT